MNKILMYIIIMIFLLACKDFDENPIQKGINFNQKILDGFSITAIAFDTKGNAWIGTNKQGLIKYNSNETKIYNSLNSIISDSSFIYDIAIDNMNNKWICSDALIKYDGENFAVYNSKNTKFIEDYVKSISIDSKGNIWITTCTSGNCRLVKFDGYSWSLFTTNTIEHCPTNFVANFAIDNYDNVWFPVINNSFVRLAKYNGNEWTLFTDMDIGISYFDLIQINSKNEVVGAMDCSLRANPVNPAEEIIIFNGNSTKKIQYDSIADIKRLFIDNMDNIWVLNYQGGFAQYSGGKWIKKDSIFMNLELNTIKQSNDHKIWIGTNNGIYISN